MTDNTHIPDNAEDDEISLLDLLQTVFDNLRLLFVLPLIAGLLTLAYGYTLPPSFTAKTTFLPPSQQQSAAASILASLGNLGGAAASLGGIRNPSDQFLAYLRSATLQNALIDRLNLQDQFGVQTKAAARGILSESVRASSAKDGLISVEVSHQNPQFAAALANAYTEELGALMARYATTEAQHRRVFFEKQLLQAKDRLTQSEIELKAIGISGSVLKSMPSTALSAVVGLQAQITAQEVKLGAMRGYLSETAPDFKQAMAELANLRAQLAKQEKATPSDAAALSRGDYVTKYREFKYHETLFELFTKQYEIARIDESREGTLIQVLDMAEPPTLKAGPKKAQMAIVASLLTALLVLVFVFGREALRKAAINPSTAEKITKIQASLRRAVGL